MRYRFSSWPLRTDVPCRRGSSGTLQAPESRRAFRGSDYNLAKPGIAAKAKVEAIYLAQRFSDHAPLIIDYWPRFKSANDTLCALLFQCCAERRCWASNARSRPESIAS